ncbi:MAG: LuxR C-terminal-related transcriptional regulator [Nocardioidaceae bacterium]
MELDDDAREVYRAMLLRPGLTLEELSAAASLSQDRVRAALDQLADLALLADDAGLSSPRPTPPRVALARAAAMAEADIRQRQQQLAALREVMESIAAEHESALHRESLVRHASRGAARDRLAELAQSATREALSLNPGRSHDPAAMAASKPLNEQALARGVAIRAIYQDSSRTDPPTLDYARWLTEAGGEVRTSPSVPLLMVVVDREIALIPWQVGDPDQGAIEIRVPALVAVLIDYFEVLWRGADPLGTARHRDVDVQGSVAQEIVRLAATGLTDDAVARRLDISSRTVRRVMSEVMEEVGASSRFQAGVEVTRRGWLA